MQLFNKKSVGIVLFGKLSRGEICVANLKAPCEWCEFGQVFIWAICKSGLLPNGPKWADSKKFGPIPWQAAEIIGGLLASDSE